jgi:uncharacterized metal-binding protein YceD (DUF177 family)
MPLLVNMRHLEAHDIHLTGALPVEELDVETSDEMIRLAEPLEYDLEVQKVEEGLLIQGRLRLPIQCQCVRCLKPFKSEVLMERWTRHLPLQGDEAAPVVNDCVDLTPYVREDTLLEFPQHPLCETECGGLPGAKPGMAEHTSGTGQPLKGSPAWDQLNKLKL